MGKNDLSKKYSLGTRIIHWATATLILIVFPLGKFMDGLKPAEKMDLVLYHAVLGLLVLLLTLIRIYFFFKHKRPERIRTGAKWNDKLVILIHNGFYFVLSGLGISGIAVFIVGNYNNALMQGSPDLMIPHNQIPPLEGHELFASLVMIMLVFHIAGIVKHFILTKENIFKRIF